jgi:hypothetical protein
VGQVDGGKRNGGSRLENENKAARPATPTIRDPAPRLGYSLKTSFYRSPLYRVGRLRSEPGAIRLSPTRPLARQCHARLGDRPCEFTFAGQSITHPEPIWAPPGANRGGWRSCTVSSVAGFARGGGDIARRRARELAADWVDQHQRWSALAWRPDLIGSRLSAWFGQHDFFWASGTRISEPACGLGIRASPSSAPRSAGWRLGKRRHPRHQGLIFAVLPCPREPWAGRGIDLLKKELRRQIQPDGGHVERSPASHLQVLRDLIDIRAALIAAERDVPSDLQIAIDGMAPVLRLYQHGDGGLALFNDTPQRRAGSSISRSRGPGAHHAFNAGAADRFHAPDCRPHAGPGG